MINDKVQTLLKELITKLDADTYAKMCNDREDREELEAIKNELSQELIVSEKSSEPSRGLILSFAKACKLQEHYQDSVGSPEEIVSTLEIETLPKFKVSNNPKFKENIKKLVDQYQLTAFDLSEVDSAVTTSIEKLQHRHQSIAWLRSLITDTSGKLDKNKVYELFTQLFPSSPLEALEVDLIATKTGLYWLIPKKLDDPAKQDWSNYYDRFAFNRFIHFPMFSGFEIRDADPNFIESAMEALDMSFHDLTEMLNSVIGIQKKETIEKYIIHDTWGHIWQADLTGFSHLYDRMEALRRPMEASTRLTYPCGNVVCLADLYFPNADKTISINEEEIETFVQAWVDNQVASILAPLLAEMTADIVEYKFILDNPDLEEKMPSSSVFKNDPAKFDFAWVDSSYFARVLKKIHRDHFHDELYRMSFNERLLLLLKDRYKHRLGDWTDAELQTQIEVTTQVILDKFEKIEKAELSNSPKKISPRNTFYNKLIPLLIAQSKKSLFAITMLLAFILAPVSNAQPRYHSSKHRTAIINGKSSLLVYPSNYNSIRYCNITGHTFAFQPIFSHYSRKHGRNVYHYTRVIPSWYNARLSAIRRSNYHRHHSRHYSTPSHRQHSSRVVIRF